MSEDERIAPPDEDSGRRAAPPTTSGPADLTYGAADPDRSDELGPSPDVHGEEGGGDPAAGAEADTAVGDSEDRERPRGFTP
ncbi:hypothetical protein V5H98_12215 [Georgenia sp. M64]|jgi:hypothetical protein|uniref:hypothetical protein n=1 Tax=Georgenia sp. M64 TaxID=3120520 RepID=UPI0030E07B13